MPPPNRRRRLVIRPVPGRVPRPPARDPRRTRRAGPPGDAGMSTAEYAVGTLAAAALAAGLHQVVTSGAILGALQGLVERALHAVL
ncbi:DUF4244 domain-containing protein [Streptomyces alkaliphilus]|nr:DUF4244 domain-containing protein [Streptomyces alkaliphilus]